jgi:hypothetical protein
MARKLEPGRYIMTDISSGMALDLSGTNDGTLIAWDLYGGTHQQVGAVVLLFSLGTGGVSDRSSFLLSVAVVMTDRHHTHMSHSIA